jgi:hypothetical protein
MGTVKFIIEIISGIVIPKIALAQLIITIERLTVQSMSETVAKL